MFAESTRIQFEPSWRKDNHLSLRKIGREFFAAANSQKLPSSVNFILEGKTEHSISHAMATPTGRARWIVRDDKLSRFFNEVSAKGRDELIIQRARHDEFRISPLSRPFSFIDLFAGIGGIRLAFDDVGGTCVFSSELDELAQQTYEANFGERPAGDITEIPPETIPDHDILAGGFPCQPFSIIGNREGFADTRGTLFFHIERILDVKRPYAVLLENVKQFRTHDQGRTCETVLASLRNLGYHPHVTVLNALDFGVAQKRERTFIVAFQDDIHFTFPDKFDWYPSLGTVFEPEAEVDPKLHASDMIQQKRLQRLEQQGREPFYPSMWHENKGGHIGMHPFSCALRHNASYNYLLVDGWRRPTGREMLRLQGFPESFKIVVNHTAIRAQCGNSVAVPVVRAIAAKMMLAMRLSLPGKRKVPTRQRSLFPV